MPAAGALEWEEKRRRVKNNSIHNCKFFVKPQKTVEANRECRNRRKKGAKVAKWVFLLHFRE